MLDKTDKTIVGTATQGPEENHDPYEGLSPTEKNFLERLRLFFTDINEFPGGVPFKLEVTNGVARERLTLNPDTHEVFMIKKKPQEYGRRKLEIDIMSEEEAKQEILYPGGSSSSAGAPAVIDPCCWWEWNGVKWVCVGYGD